MGLWQQSIEAGKAEFFVQNSSGNRGIEMRGTPRVFYSRASEGNWVNEVYTPNPRVYDTQKYTGNPWCQTRPKGYRLGWPKSRTK
jgi:hypothetical protein